MTKYVVGLRSVEQLLNASCEGVQALHAEYTTTNPRIKKLFKIAQNKQIPIYPANRQRLSQMSQNALHQGVVAVIQPKTLLNESEFRSFIEETLMHGKKSLLLLVLEEVQDPHNLGACIRTAESAGADALIVPKSRAAFLTPVVSKVAAGAAEILPFAAVGSLPKTLAWLSEYGVNLIATSDKATQSVYNIDYKPSTAFVMGGEYLGVRKQTEKYCHQLVKLPMKGSLSSLNVSVASGICLYEAVRQRSLNTQ